MPKVGGVGETSKRKVQILTFLEGPRGFRGEVSHLTCKVLSPFAALTEANLLAGPP